MRGIRRLHGNCATIAAVLAGLLWSWLDTRTLLGPESGGATRWRLAAFAAMAACALLAWSRSRED